MTRRRPGASYGGHVPAPRFAPGRPGNHQEHDDVPEQVRLHVALENLFPGRDQDQAVWLVDVPETIHPEMIRLEAVTRGPWGNFAQPTGPLHDLLVRRARGLADVRSALRVCRARARKHAGIGPAATEYAELLRLVLDARWLESIGGPTGGRGGTRTAWSTTGPRSTSSSRTYTSSRRWPRPPVHSRWPARRDGWRPSRGGRWTRRRRGSR